MRTSFVSLAALALVAAATPAAAQSAKVQAGVLVCSVAPSVGFVIGSIREMNCELRTAQVQPYNLLARYKGTVSRFGIDIGVSTGGTLGWAVFAPTSQIAPGNISGTYVGVSADAAWAIGGGANVLLGGSNNTVALQPLSLEGVTGAMIAAGISDMKLALQP
ncbi:DUF992 domain-containing protein [Xanthobacter tagetidis]|uniref:DUF992 domain-containing protein n=1 Tax=Xanthobacter tagetidis TaxID=60216 RepID=A0A3L7ADF7_9HYPH|nr:DUF992 domain-containing protein [Xanthobacter tagetidis]MBB6306129.1 hypothetical protein [Xanthobacter tagetidis]RLP77681.1 DUF992 domain-containing protein [Xanthobacter tagetidis]